MKSAPALGLVVERATVYRMPGTRRYFSRRSAIRAYAVKRYLARHQPRTCECGYSGFGDEGCSCRVDVHEPDVRRVIDRFERWLRWRLR